MKHFKIFLRSSPSFPRCLSIVAGTGLILNLIDGGSNFKSCQIQFMNGSQLLRSGHSQQFSFIL